MKPIFKSFGSVFSSMPIGIKTFVLLSLLHVFYGAAIGLFQDILPIHEWRKTDSLSFALNYIHSNNLFEPHTNFILQNGHTNAAAEFPIIYFLIGKLWGIFGVHVGIAKMFSVVTLFTAISLFSVVMKTVLRSELKVLLFVFLLYSSPILVTYADSCMPNVIALSFLMYAGFFLHRYMNYATKKKRSFLLFTLFLSLALLIKVTAILAVLAMVFGYFVYVFFNKKLFAEQKRVVFAILASFIFACIVTVLWYQYAIRYNQAHDVTTFSTTTRPIWEANFEMRQAVWAALKDKQQYLFYHPLLLAISLIVYFYLSIKGRISVFYHAAFVGGLTLLSAYFILWFWVFDVHDYYLIEILFVPLVLFTAILKGIDLKAQPLPAKISGTIVLIWITIQSQLTISVCFGSNKFDSMRRLLVSEKLVDERAYFHWYHQDHLKQLQDHVDEINQLIEPDARILCLSDDSPNVHLFTLRHEGFTNMRIDQQDRTASIQSCIDQGARYLLIIGRDRWDDTVAQFTDERIYQFKNIELFTLVKPFVNNSTHEPNNDPNKKSI